MRSSLAPRQRLAGFFLCASVLIGLLPIGLGVTRDLSLSSWMVWLPALVVGVLFIIAMHEDKGTIGENLPKQRPRTFWMGLATAVFAAIVAWISSSSPSLSSMVLLALSLAILMLSVFRLTMSWYIGLSLIAGMVVLEILSDSNLATIVVIAAVVGWAVMNYAVQLFLDHDSELREFWSLDFLPKSLATGKATLLAIPVFLLVAAGGVIHTEIQSQLLATPYSLQISYDDEPLIPQDCPHVQEDADALERALIECSIERRRVAALADAQRMIAEAGEGFSSGLAETPKQVAELLAKTRPKEIDGHAACHGFTYKKKFVSLSFTTPCRGLVAHINEVMTGSHNRAMLRINAAAESYASRTDKTIEENMDEFRAAVLESINESFDELSRAVSATFWAFRALGVLSLLVLLVSVIAAFQMILGRVLFHKHPVSVFARPMNFQLVTGSSQPISKTRSDSLLLSSGCDRATTWFVKMSVARRGDDTSQRAVISQPLACVLNRVFAGAYVLTRIDAESGSSAVISMAGDTKLVRIVVKKGQSLCFRMSDLVAFTSGVALRSRYNTHVGTHILRLGTIYSVAEGEGMLVLRSEGSKVAELQPEESTPSTNLLVWDEALPFALDQRLGMVGLWVNPPSVVYRSDTPGAALVDEGAPERFPLLARAWSLLRYLFLPI